MALKMKPTQLYLVLMAVSTMVVAVAVDQATSATPRPPKQTMPGCKFTCGNVEVQYPFGIGYSSISPHQPCFMNRSFNLTCKNDTKLYLGNVPVSHIDIQGQIEVWTYVSKLCKNDSDGKANKARLVSGSYTVSSSENKFITVGCDTYGYLKSFYDGDTYSTGCLTKCYGNNPDKLLKKSQGNCTGIGCCQVDIPVGMKNTTVKVFNFSNSTDSFGNCSYSFVAKNGFYNFSVEHLWDLPFTRSPLILNWAVGSGKCETAKSGNDYACRANSECEDKNIDEGYRCKCHQGYEGNPYHPDGCRDIDECTSGHHNCISKGNCRNNIGSSYTCFCPKGHSGNGTMEDGCYQPEGPDVITKVIIGIGAGVILLLLGTSSLYLMYQKRKLIKLKQKFFQQNGGFMLQQQLSTREDSSQTAQIFTEDQLKKATNNYDESFIIGRGGYGTVYKGFLAHNRIVAVKKSKIIDASQIEQFINEVIVLSQINHRNVVKLLGCCLETEVPLLVYEFVSNGTLFSFIHTEGKVNNGTWKTRLRIAAEAAGALSYLHSAASIPIIHRDVKSTNILLDDTYTAKVSDFGASRLVPIDQTDIATIVQGTIGYLDPEYMQTSQLTEKSDVYSFGVVLAELLTGEKPLSFDRPEEKRSLAMHFLSSLKEDCLFEILQVGILNEENKQEIKEVAILAAKCLRLIGEERPSMKEVAMELEGIRMLEKHPWTNIDQNLEETQYLLLEASSSINEAGDSSNHGYIGYDSLRDHVLIALDDGR